MTFLVSDIWQARADANGMVCIPSDMFTSLMASSQAAFAQAVVWYILVSFVLGVAFTLGFLHLKTKIDEMRAGDD